MQRMNVSKHIVYMDDTMSAASVNISQPWTASFSLIKSASQHRSVSVSLQRCNLSQSQSIYSMSAYYGLSQFQPASVKICQLQSVSICLIGQYLQFETISILVLR